jgi:hypothetical protein
MSDVCEMQVLSSPQAGQIHAHFLQRVQLLQSQNLCAMRWLIYDILTRGGGSGWINTLET